MRGAWVRRRLIDTAERATGAMRAAARALSIRVNDLNVIATGRWLVETSLAGPAVGRREVLALAVLLLLVVGFVLALGVGRVEVEGCAALWVGVLNGPHLHFPVAGGLRVCAWWRAAGIVWVVGVVD